MRAIPTCVGTTPRMAPREDPSPGHPHVRGDYHQGAGGHPAHVGPSPRAWGLLRGHDERKLIRRAIPTCVGTTGGTGAGAAGVPGHPHVRGDYDVNLSIIHNDAGHPHVRGDYRQGAAPENLPGGPSPRAWGLRFGRGLGGAVHGPSPRAWGLRVKRKDGKPGRRAIPTCVGTTPGLWPRLGGPSGHPHVRGDYT